MAAIDLPDLPARADHEERMKVARRVSRWDLGDPSWADAIIEGYLHPKAVTEGLDDVGAE